MYAIRSYYEVGNEGLVVLPQHRLVAPESVQGPGKGDEGAPPGGIGALLHPELWGHVGDRAVTVLGVRHILDELLPETQGVEVE